MSIPSQARAWTMAAALTGVLVPLSTPVQAAPAFAAPSDASVRTPLLKYQSPFAGVRRLSDALGEWRPGQAAAPKPSEKEHDHHHHHGHVHAPVPREAASHPHAGHVGK